MLAAQCCMLAAKPCMLAAQHCILAAQHFILIAQPSGIEYKLANLVGPIEIQLLLSSAKTTTKLRNSIEQG